MKIFIYIFIFMFGFFNNIHASSNGTAYEYSFNGIDGNLIKLSEYKEKVIVVVNVASRCGYTPQYNDLQKLWTNYKDKDVIIIGIPSNNFKQEPGSNKEIKDFCETNFGIDFPITEKTNVIGNEAHPFYKWARKDYGIGAIPKWNFHKIIIGKEGNVVETFASFTKPTSSKFIKTIDKQIKN